MTEINVFIQMLTLTEHLSFFFSFENIFFYYFIIIILDNNTFQLKFATKKHLWLKLKKSFLFIYCAKTLSKTYLVMILMAVMIWTKTARIFFRLAPVLICPCRFTLFKGYRYYPYLTTINFTDGVGA